MISFSQDRLQALSGWLQKVPPWIFGKTRFARFLLKPFFKATNIPVTDKWGNRFLLPSAKEPIGFFLISDGMYEPLTMRLLFRHLARGSTFVDVGANIGVFTIPLAKQVGTDGRVLAIEPSPRIFPYLRDNVQMNRLGNVRLQNCAAYHCDQSEVPFYESPQDQFGMGSLGAQFHEQPVAVPAQTLDSLLEKEGLHHVDLLKVDVEGYEQSVFKGAQRLLSAPDAPILLFEFCDWAETRAAGGHAGNAQRLLWDYGYEIWHLSDFLGKKRGSCKEILVKGFAMLVAIKTTCHSLPPSS